MPSASQADVSNRKQGVEPAAARDDGGMRYFNGTGRLAIFTGTETMIGRTCMWTPGRRQQAWPSSLIPIGEPAGQ